MTAKTTITLQDSALTPESPGTPAAANRVFTPGAMEAGFVHTFGEPTTGTTSDTKSKLTLSLKPATASSPSRVKVRIDLPKAQTVDGIVKRAHLNRVYQEFVFDKDSTRDDRRDARAMIAYINNDAGYKAVIDDLEDLY